MRNYLRLFILLFFIGFSLNCYAAQAGASSFKSAPAFQLADLNDQAVFLSGYKGKKTVILLFWTTWCPYCREELKTLNQEYAGLAKDSLELLAINVGEPKYKVENFAKSRNLTFTVLLDKDSTVADAYELMGVPTYFVINKAGQIVSTSNHFPKGALKELTGK